jgi:hypothetical protein
MTRKSSTLSLLLLAACLAACSHKKSHNGNNDPFGGLPPPTAKPAGSFTGTAADLNEVNQNMYCSFGNGESKYSIDERLKVGMKFETDETWLATEGFYSGRGHVAIEIQLADPADLRLKRKVDLLGMPNWWYTDYCEGKNTETDRGAYCETQEVSPALSDLQAKSKRSQQEHTTTHSASCYVTDTSGDTGDNKYEKGTFTLKSGKQVPAFRKFEKFTGSIKCGDNEAVKGTWTVEQIVSKDVPNPELTCDTATVIFKYEVMKDESGKTLMEEQKEIYNF